MSKSTRILWLFLVFGGMTLALASPPFAQDDVPVSQRTTLTYAHDFLKVFYPELFDKKYRVTLCASAPGDNDWLVLGGVFFVVTPADIYPLHKLIVSSPQSVDHILLGGSIWLPPHQYGRVMEVHAFSTAVHEQQLEKMRLLLESHPGWSEAQMVSALKQAGAQFGPDDKDAFVNSLPLAKAEAFLGHLKIISVEFNYPNREQHVGHFASGALTWHLRTDALLPDGKRVQYGLEFEPFEGKLVSLTQFGVAE
jgi:hypothetical protein